MKRGNLAPAHVRHEPGVANAVDGNRDLEELIRLCATRLRHEPGAPGRPSEIALDSSGRVARACASGRSLRCTRAKRRIEARRAPRWRQAL
jgi:hypothetical protein